MANDPLHSWNSDTNLLYKEELVSFLCTSWFSRYTFTWVICLLMGLPWELMSFAYTLFEYIWLYIIVGWCTFIYSTFFLCCGLMHIHILNFFLCFYCLFAGMWTTDPFHHNVSPIFTLYLYDVLYGWAPHSVPCRFDDTSQFFRDPIRICGIF